MLGCAVLCMVAIVLCVAALIVELYDETRRELQEMEELKWGLQGLLYAMQGANSRHMEKDSTLDYYVVQGSVAVSQPNVQPTVLPSVTWKDLDHVELVRRSSFWGLSGACIATRVKCLARSCRSRTRSPLSWLFLLVVTRNSVLNGPSCVSLLSL